jgi:hypothetical protein
MGTLVNDIVVLNASEISLLETYRLAADKRLKAISKGSGSAEQLLHSIRRLVESQYGKKSPEAAIIAGFLKKMHSTHTIVQAAAEGKEEATTTVSRSRRSYGAITQTFNDAVNALAQFTAYAPANDALKITSLQTTAQNLTQLSDDVANCTVQLKNVRSERKAKYDDLTNRIARIKSYVDAQYGPKSKEARMIRETGI